MSVDGTGWERRNEGFAAAMTDAQMAYVEAEREDAARGELVEDMWALWYNGCDCTECPERIHAECRRDEHLGVGGCNAMGYVRQRAAAVGIELEW